MAKKYSLEGEIEKNISDAGFQIVASRALDPSVAKVLEQEARGGVQPSLRDRRPPVSRDLRIGFGNQPNPDANGRGGPSQHKKSRGTASLVLGVPIPDRIKGQPNPGKTKITQERIEPRAEEGTTLDAGERGTRQGTVGRLGRPEMTPWMRRLVGDYFRVRRQQGDRVLVLHMERICVGS